MIPFQPASMEPEELQRLCVDTRRKFYSWKSILRRGVDSVNRADSLMFRHFFAINAMHRADVSGRNHYPLGDASWRGQLLQA